MLRSNDRIIKHKVGLLNLANELGNISKACKMMSVSRYTFYRRATMGPGLTFYIQWSRIE